MRYLIRALGWLILYAAVTLIVLGLLNVFNVGEAAPLMPTGLVVGVIITAGIALAARWYDRKRRRGERSSEERG